MQLSNYWLYIVTLVLFINGKYLYAKQELPVAVHGQINLKEHNFQNNGIVKLNGEWEFYWNKFIDKKDTHIIPEYIEVPGLWNSVKHNGRNIGSEGYATYCLTVKVKHPQCFAIKFINAATSCNIFIDGKMVYNAGIPATNHKDTEPSYKPSVIEFTPDSNEFEIFLQIANFHHKKGGAWEPIAIGLSQQVRKSYNRQVFYEAFFMGSVFIMGVFHLVIFLFHPKEKPALFFSLFAIAMSLRMAVTGAYSVYIIGDFSWGGLIRTDYLCFYLALLFFLMYIKSLFKEEVNKITSIIFIPLSILFSLSVLILPPRYFSYGMVFYHGVAVIFCGFVFYVMIRSKKKKLSGTKLFLSGFIALFLTMIYDILRVNEIIYVIPLSSVGITIFISFQASFLSLRIRRALVINEELTEVLELQNKEYVYLNNKYYEQNQALNLAKEKAEESDLLKTAFLENMSHEIRTPMNGIMGFLNLLENIKVKPEEKSRYINIVRESGERMLSTINDIVDASKLNTGQVDVAKQKVSIKNTVETLFNSLQKEADSKNIELIIRKELKDDEDEVYTDPVKLDKILYNLVKNALKYTVEGEVRIVVEAVCDYIKFSVIDTGVGISPNKKETIFKPFEQINNETLLIEGIGLGLSNSKSYVEMLGGEIWLESTVGKGSKFYFTIPRF